MAVATDGRETAGARAERETAAAPPPPAVWSSSEGHGQRSTGTGDPRAGESPGPGGVGSGDGSDTGRVARWAWVQDVKDGAEKNGESVDVEALNGFIEGVTPTSLDAAWTEWAKTVKEGTRTADVAKRAVSPNSKVSEPARAAALDTWLAEPDTVNLIGADRVAQVRQAAQTLPPEALWQKLALSVHVKLVELREEQRQQQQRETHEGPANQNEQADTAAQTGSHQAQPAAQQAAQQPAPQTSTEAPAPDGVTKAGKNVAGAGQRSASTGSQSPQSVKVQIAKLIAAYVTATRGNRTAMQVMAGSAERSANPNAMALADTATDMTLAGDNRYEVAPGSTRAMALPSVAVARASDVAEPPAATMVIEGKAEVADPANGPVQGNVGAPDAGQSAPATRTPQATPPSQAGAPTPTMLALPAPAQVAATTNHTAGMGVA